MIRYFLILLLLISCTQTRDKPNKKTLNTVLDSWHQAASNADFDTYSDLMATDARFIGTASAENWSKKQFMEFSKPFFDKGKAWSFKPLERNIYSNNNIVWFDEQLETWMGICRGSGVLIQENDNWKIKHYVLSLAIPNETITAIININDSINKKIVSKFKK